MRLDGLVAEEEPGGDLGVGLAIDDEPRHLELARRQCLDAGAVDLARPRAPVVPMAEPSELALGLVAVAARTARVERGGGAPQLLDCTGPVAGPGERTAGER